MPEPHSHQPPGLGLGTTAIVRPASILDPLPLETWFDRKAPIEIEIGSGDGSFLVAYALAHPELNLVGVERLLGRLRKTDRKLQRAGLTHVRLIRFEAAYFLRYLVPAGSVRALHIYFPDPWPKKKHHRHRLIQAGFPAVAAQALGAAGRVYLRTDDPDYFRQMQEVFGADDVFEAVDTPEPLAALTTDFEREFNREGVATLRAAYQRRTRPPAAAGSALTI